MNAATRTLPLLVLAACALLLDRAARLDPASLVPDLVLTVDGLPELSGVVAARTGGTLFVVTDEGVVAQLDQRGRTLRRGTVPGADLEALAWSRAGDRLLALDEARSRVLSLDPDTFDVQETLALPAPRAGPLEGLGYEGLACRAGDLLALRQAEPCAILRLAPGGRALLGETPVDAEEASALLLLEREAGCVVLSPGRGLRLYGPDLVPRGPWVPVVGRHIEGVALLQGFGLVFVTDETPSRLLVVTVLRDTERLVHRLQGNAE